MAEIERVSPEETREKVKSGKAFLVCAYESDEKFAQVHLKGAMSLSAFKEKIGTLSKDQEIIFYCNWPAENSSVSLAEKYLSQGFTNVWALKGGVEGWKKAGFALI